MGASVAGGYYSPEALRVIARIQQMRKAQQNASVVDRADPRWRHWYGFSDFARRQLKIVDPEKKLFPFELRDIQRMVWSAELRARRQGKRPWFLILKYRKVGITTLEQGLNFWTTWAWPHQECLTLAHRDEDMRNIWRMVTRFYSNQPKEFRHQKTIAEVSEIKYPSWDSIYQCSVAGDTGGGRGSTFSRVHIAEAAHVTDLMATHTALAESIGPKSAYILESTPNGREGRGQAFYEFWQMAKRGQNEFIPLFIPWHMERANQIALIEPDEIDTDLVGEAADLMRRFKLTKPQMKWWLAKRRGLVANGTAGAVIHQEHPSDDDSCFIFSDDCYYDLNLVSAAERRTTDPIAVEDNGRLRIWELPDINKPADYVMGVDPAGGTGNDDAGVVIINARTGRQAATYRWNKMPPDDLGRFKLDEFGKRWKNPSSGTPAYIVIEANNHGHATLAGLLKMAQYPVDRVYHQTDEAKVDRFGDTKAGSRPGWLNTITTHADLTATIGRMLREADPLILDVEVVRAIRRVGNGPSGAVFSGRDLAVAAGLAAIGLPFARQVPEPRVFMGGRIVDLDAL